MVKQQVVLTSKQRFESPYRLDHNKVIKAAEKALDKLEKNINRVTQVVLQEVGRAKMVNVEKVEKISSDINELEQKISEMKTQWEAEKNSIIGEAVIKLNEREFGRTIRRGLEVGFV